MINFDNLTLSAFIQENKDFFKDARIQKIQQPTRREFLISIRSNGQTRKLYINIIPNLHHICFMSKENEIRRHIQIPKTPPMFCMLLRKYIENAKIVRVTQPPYERIFEIYFEAYNELSEIINLCLAVELMGKHSNVILYNADTSLIIGCAHNVGSEKSKDREMAGNLPYIYPKKQNKRQILTYNGQINYSTLSEDFLGFSKAFANMCHGFSTEELKDFIELKGLSPIINYDYSQYSLFAKTLSGEKQSDVNSMIDNYYAYHQEKFMIQELKNKLLSAVKGKLKKTQGALTKINIQLQKELNSDKYRQFGDLIMANLYIEKDYQEKITVFDWQKNTNVEINLNNTKTLKENATQYFKLYNKIKRSCEKLQKFRSEIELQEEYLKQTLYTIEAADTINILNEIKQEIMLKKNGSKVELSNIFKMDILGFSVYVGKNNRQNDYIVSKLSKDNDLWFHALGCAGSHVLLKIFDNKEPSEKVILECAKLAKQNSNAKNSTKASIIYTRRKYLKKPPAAKLGYVTYKNEKEILID